MGRTGDGGGRGGVGSQGRTEAGLIALLMAAFALWNQTWPVVSLIRCSLFSLMKWRQNSMSVWQQDKCTMGCMVW